MKKAFSFLHTVWYTLMRRSEEAYGVTKGAIRYLLYKEWVQDDWDHVRINSAMSWQPTHWSPWHDDRRPLKRSNNHNPILRALTLLQPSQDDDPNPQIAKVVTGDQSLPLLPEYDCLTVRWIQSASFYKGDFNVYV